ncbi:hypothetical protein QYE76_025704 [Lolium multiflorum]|uniref:Uncharacterized protein n=1 Tax=Lolium multiflorum TaxID=4521 RepID=A0AAD8RHD5_LOLMU|nr:hypothetical protein QYE76_025704 [Lolium multiflorum]
MRRRLLWTPRRILATRAELETLRKELEDLEERVRVTKQLIQDKEALVARVNHRGIPKLRAFTLLDHVVSFSSLDP